MATTRKWRKAFIDVIKANKAAATAIIAAGATVITVVAYGTKVYDLCAKWVDGHLKIVAGAAHADVTIVIVVVAALGLAVGLLAATGLLLGRAVGDEVVGSPTREALQRAAENAKLIVEQTYPASVAPPWRFEKVTVDISIAINGDTTITREDHVRAQGAPLHYWSQQLEGEDDSKPVDFVEELQYVLTDVSSTRMPGQSVAYLVIDNGPRAKEVAVFHLPRIETTEAAVREIRTSFTWPGFSRKLADTGVDNWSWTLKSVVNVPLFEMTVTYAAELGRVDAKVIGKRVPTASLTRLTDGAWKYTVTDSPADSFKHELRFTKAR